MAMLQSYKTTYTLNAESIDTISSLIASLLKNIGTESRAITRCRLSIEEILRVWNDSLGSDSICEFSCGTRITKQYIRLSVNGARINPLDTDDELYSEALGGQNLISGIGLATVYAYRNGLNEITVTPPPKYRNQLRSIALSLILAVIVGLPLKLLFPELCAVIIENAVSPLFDTMMNLLAAIASPMIFLAVCSGIYGIGDLALFGRVGKKLILRYTLMTFVVLAATLALSMWCFPISVDKSAIEAGESWKQIYLMLLNIIPPDIITPFYTGNAMQIIFLGSVTGMGVLILGNKVSALAEIVGQIQSIVRLLMEAIGHMVPAFVFICVLNIIISDIGLNIGGLGKEIILCVILSFLVILVYLITMVLKYHVRISFLLKKLLPTFIIALTTASSAATFETNVETCIKKLGINEKIVNFGIPLGQVIYMPSGAIIFLISSMCMGELYDISITPIWLIVSLIVSGILAIATQPIPGGSLSCYTILFTQLGIPASGIALAISADILMDAVITACNLICLQCELTLAADKLDMLDVKKLAE